MRNAASRDALHLLAVVASVCALIIHPALLDVLLPGLFVIYGALILSRALRGPDAQPHMHLSGGDVPAQLWCVIGAALILSAFSDGLIMAAQINGAGYLQPWIITIFSTGNLAVIGLLSLSPDLRGAGTERSAPISARPAPDAAIMDQINAYMAARKPYLDPELTLARLSRKLGLPAKQVSATINAATGENVSRFINGARIRAAQAQMLAGQSVTQAMLSAGFQTKSNFNREFLRVTGTTPRDWLASQ